MRRSRLKTGISLGLCAALVLSSVGCHTTPSVAKLAYFGHKELAHYEDMATEIAYPEQSSEMPRNPNFAQPPRTIYEIAEDKIWDLTLSEAIEIALKNGAIVKDDGSFGSPGNPVFANPNGTRTAYDIAILESGILFGGRGVEAALADFDAQLTTTMTWGRSEQIQNAPFLNLAAGAVLSEETGNFSTQLQKQLANSGIFTLQHDMNYSGNNVDSRQFLSAFTGFVQAEYRQPLLAGSGAEFTRVAGPIGTNLQGVSGVAQGVVISRINSDIAIADFEGSIASMLRDVENRYRDLHLFYKIYDSERVAADNALEYWLVIKDRADTGEEQVTQAAEGYYDAIRRVENSLADINDNEARLRRLLGLAPRDDKGVIRPIEKPIAANLVHDWTTTLAEALSRRPELRSQKWNIVSLEKQLSAARSLVRPRFDLVAQYRVNQFGDQLFGDGDAPEFDTMGNPIPNFINDSAYESLTSNLTANWNLGLQWAMPLGLRTAHTQVRNYEFRLRKARAVLAAQEMEVTHELDAAWKNINRWRTSIRADLERLEWAKANLKEAAFSLQKGRSSGGDAANRLSRVLQAQVRVREAQINYFRDLTEYTKAITELNFRKGSLLADSNVHLSEGAWCPSAYQDALRRAWSRTYAKDSTKLESRPIEFTAEAPNHPNASPRVSAPPRSPFVGEPQEDKPAENPDEILDELNKESPSAPEGDDDDTEEVVIRTGYAKPKVAAPFTSGRPTNQRQPQTQRPQPTLKTLPRAQTPASPRASHRQVIRRPAVKLDADTARMARHLNEVDRRARRTGASK